MHVLVTGASGFIGRRLLPALAGRHQVSALTRHPLDVPGVASIVADLRDPGFVGALPPRIDAVVALAQSRRYREFPEGAQDVFDVNVGALMRLLDGCRGAGVRRLVYTSSANVYQRSDAPIDEQGVVAPPTFYARTKRMAELLVESFASPALAATALRVFTVYGPGQTGSLVPDIIARVRDGRAVELDGQDGLRLSPILIDDVCAVIDALLVQDAPPPFALFNLGGPEPVSLRELARRVGRAVGRAPTFTQRGTPDPSGWIADGGRLRACLAGLTMTSLDEGLRRTVAS